MDRLEERALLSGWAIAAGGSGFDGGSALAFDPGSLDGSRPASLYMAGDFGGTADFNGSAPGGQLTSAGGQDGFLARYAPDGTLLGSPVQVAGPQIDLVRAAAVDPDGNVYIGGMFGGTTTIGGTTLTSRGGRDAFLAKIGPDGVIQWARGLGGADAEPGWADEAVYGLVADASGVYATGSFLTSAYLDNTTPIPQLTSAGYEDGFVVKLDPSGGLVYANKVGGASYGDYGYQIAVDGAGRAYVTGSFLGTASFGPSIVRTSRGPSDGYIAQLDAAGNFTWVRQTGGAVETVNSTESAYGLAVGGGRVYATGVFFGQATFGDPANPADVGATTLTSRNDRAAFVTALDDSGHFLWTRPFGGTTATNSLGAVALDAAGDLYAIGSLERGAVDFDPGAGSAVLASRGDNPDIVVVRLGPQGDFRNVWQMGGAGADYGRGIAVDPAGHIYTTGSFDPGAGFDTGTGTVSPAGAGGRDAFVAKTTQALGTILGQVYVDRDGDGVLDGDEAGMIGRTVTLHDGGGTLLATTTTGASGAYIFRHLPAGTYSVRHAAASGWSQTAGSAPIVVGAGSSVTSRDLGFASSVATRTFSNTKALKLRDNGSVDSTLTITNASTIYDLNVRLDLSHPRLADLSIRLIAPNGLGSVDLIRYGEAVGNRLPGTTFDDQAGRWFTAGTTPDGGSYRPTESDYPTYLAAFEGKPLNGTWTLRIHDHTKGNTGTLNNWSLIVTGSNLGSGLQAAGGPSSSDARTPKLRQGQAMPLVRAAFAHWRAAGVSASRLAALRDVEVRIDDLGGSTLGIADGKTIWLDDDAAGHGWHIDRKPLDNRDVRQRRSHPAADRVDLLTVLVHEVGHLLGHDHAEGGVMADRLAPAAKALRLRPAGPRPRA